MSFYMGLSVETYKGNDYLVDMNENKVSLKLYSRNEAIRLLDTLTDCDNCVNCENLESCSDCIDCKNSSYLTDCTDCVNCNDCEECNRCYYCEDLEEFDDGRYLKHRDNVMSRDEHLDNLIDFYNESQFGGSYE